MPVYSKKEKILGIDKFHNAGYFGDGIIFVEMESPNSKHGKSVLEEFYKVAPKATAILKPSGYRKENSVATGSTFDTLQYIIDNKVNIFGAALDGVNEEEVNEAFRKAIESGAIGACSAGNEGKEGTTKYTQADVLISVGALDYSEKLDKIYLESYSSRGKGLDVVVLLLSDTKEGTSFSFPVFAGMIALVQEFFLKEVRRTLRQEEFIKFMLDNIVDLGAIGHDEDYGHGLFILPEPESIDISKYIGADNMEIKFKENDKKFYIDGEHKESRIAPFIKNGVMLVPLREFSEAFGARVDWNEKTKFVTITK